jgi:hypothetical protein
MEIALFSNEKWVGGAAGAAAYCTVGKRLSDCWTTSSCSYWNLYYLFPAPLHTTDCSENIS